MNQMFVIPDSLRRVGRPERPDDVGAPSFSYPGPASLAMPDEDQLFSFIQDTLGQIRVLHIPDRFRESREVWLRTFLRPSQQCTYRNGEIDFAAQHSVSFEILVISGDDRARVQSILRMMRKLLPSKVLVVVTANCTRSERVKFLTAGADDVLHLGMGPNEGAMRLHALSRRLAWRAEEFERTRREAEERKSLVRQISAMAHRPLTQQELLVLTLLLRKEGGAVPYREFLKVSEGKTLVASKASLSVVITHIRAKLDRKWEIRNLRGEGFLLRARREDAASRVCKQGKTRRSEQLADFVQGRSADNLLRLKGVHALRN